MSETMTLMLSTAIITITNTIENNNVQILYVYLHCSTKADLRTEYLLLRGNPGIHKLYSNYLPIDFYSQYSTYKYQYVIISEQNQSDIFV